MNIKITALSAILALTSGTASFAGGAAPFVDCDANPNQEGCAVVVVDEGQPGSLGGLGVAGIAGGVLAVAALAAILSNDDDDDDSTSASSTPDT